MGVSHPGGAGQTVEPLGLEWKNPQKHYLQLVWAEDAVLHRRKQAGQLTALGQLDDPPGRVSLSSTQPGKFHMK